MTMTLRGAVKHRFVLKPISTVWLFLMLGYIAVLVTLIACEVKVF